ncbi:MAG: hypothetical protein L3J83_04515 [Proteobacteria bacterium]|nr:hypothetical protein [Pseudomonadota bacterium]
MRKTSIVLIAVLIVIIVFWYTISQKEIQEESLNSTQIEKTGGHNHVNKRPEQTVAIPSNASKKFLAMKIPLKPLITMILLLMGY